ncbi:MAG: hypothetical protein AAFO06_07495 [Cyanobacteria bacterium J06597_16]
MKLSIDAAKGVTSKNLDLQKIGKQAVKRRGKQSVAPFKKLAQQMVSKMTAQTASTKPTDPPAVSSAEPTPTDPTPTDSVSSVHSTSHEKPKRLPFIKDSKGSRLAFNLLLVRPWILVVGLWIVSAMGASLAWKGMISPRKLMMELPQPVSTETDTAANTNTFLKVEQDTPQGQTTASGTEAEQTSEPTINVADNSGLPMWPIGALVGTCAAGCLAISRRRAMVRMTAGRVRSKRKVRASMEIATGKPKQAKSMQRSSVRKTVKATPRQAEKLQTAKMQKTSRLKRVIGTSQKAPHKSVKSKASQSVRAKAGQPKERNQPRERKLSVLPSSSQAAVRGAIRPKKRRQRRKSGAAPLKPVAAGGRVLASRSNAQTREQPQQKTARKTANRNTASQGRQPQRRPIRSQRQAGGGQSIVSVVPANASHALDWTHGSLAHQMDVRPPRTASM